MDTREAEDLLHDSDDVVAFATGSMSYVKQLVEQCLDNDIPATIGKPPGSGKS